MGIEFKGVGPQLSLMIGYVPERKSPAVAIIRGSVVKVVAYCRSDDDMLELQQALAELWGVSLPPPEEASDE